MSLRLTPKCLLHVLFQTSHEYSAHLCHALCGGGRLQSMARPSLRFCLRALFCDLWIFVPNQIKMGFKKKTDWGQVRASLHNLKKNRKRKEQRKPGSNYFQIRLLDERISPSKAYMRALTCSRRFKRSVKRVSASAASRALDSEHSLAIETSLTEQDR